MEKNGQPSFTLGAEGGDHIRVEVTARAHPDAPDFWDGNGWLTIEVVGDGRGHMDTGVELLDQPGIGNRLSFRVPGIDQTHIADVIAHLCEIERLYPTLGSPDD